MLSHRFASIVMLLAVTSSFIVGGFAQAGQLYQVTESGVYSYIPGDLPIETCLPSRFNCQFHVQGQFELDQPIAGPWRFAHVNFTLIGNETLQESIPGDEAFPFGSRSLGLWLQSLTFEPVDGDGPFEVYADPRFFPDLILTNLGDGNVALQGQAIVGLDSPTLQFDLRAHAVPEPASLTLLAVAAAGLGGLRWPRGCRTVLGNRG